MKWTTEKHNFLLELVDKHNRKWKIIAEEMTKQFNEIFSSEQCRSRWRNNRHKLDEIDPIQKYGKKVTTHADGTKTIEQLIETYAGKELNTPKDILLANNLDPKEWRLINHELSVWGQYSNKEGSRTLHASKIKIGSIADEFTHEDLINVITDKVTPININTVKYKTKDKRALGIYLMDLHFGVNTLDDYQDTLKEISYYLNRAIYEEVIITFGSDLLHVDNLSNTTANQTRINDVDIVQMIEDAKQFYITLVDIAEKQSNKVNIFYVKGNHDQSTSHLLAHWLDAYYRKVDKINVDYTIQETKIHTFGKNFLAFSHGDKGGKRRKNVLASKYPNEWAKTNVRELYTGHVHHEKSLDEFGIIERTLPTRAKTDKWHEDNSYEGAHKRFAIFEYTTEKVKSIHYV